MKKKQRVLAAIMIFILLVPLLASCENDPHTEDSSAPEPTALELYNSAAEQLKNNGLSFELDTYYEETRTSGFSETTYYEDSYSTVLSYGTPEMKADTNSEICYPNRMYGGVYTDGVLYQVYCNEKFQTRMSVEEYIDYIIPPVMFDPSYYSEVGFGESDDSENTVIYFSGAEKAEAWLAPDYAVLFEFSGESVIDKNGRIISNSCSLEFMQGPAVVEITVSNTIEYLEGELPTVDVPEDADDYETIDSAAAPVLLTRVKDNAWCGVLEYALTSCCSSEASGYIQTSTKNITMFDVEDELFIDALTSVAGRFSDGTVETHNYRESLNGTDYVQDYDGEVVTATLGDEDINSLKNACENVLMSYLSIDQELISNVGEQYSDGYLLITMTGNKEASDQYVDTLNEYLYGDESLLDSYGQYTIRKNVTTITVDLNTYLPVALCVDFEVVYNIDGVDYKLAEEVLIRISVGNPDVYYSFTGEYYPAFEYEPEEEEMAKPLFYKVTGDNGQEMWLLGTIHVGDNRTAYLPDEIYQAFDSADAAAFEIDAVELQKEMEEMDEYSELHYLYEFAQYDHYNIDPSLYTDAEYLLRVMGVYGRGTYLKHQRVDYSPIYVWTSTIESTYLSQYYALSSAKGVDMRLLLRAKAAGKPIYEIEDRYHSLKAVQKYGGSEWDDAWELSLKSVVQTPRSEYHLGWQSLYEVWCTGDLEMLTELINAEPDYTGMGSEKQIETYKRFNEDIGNSRDANMLETAKTYLESGETVFYAVGLAHLLDNETGLVEALREAGYTVELVEYAE